MTYLFLLWYITALWVIWRFTTDRTELTAAAIAVILGPFTFPIIFVSRVFITEKKKWQISYLYRDNYSPQKYTIQTKGKAP